MSPYDFFSKAAHQRCREAELLLWSDLAKSLSEADACPLPLGNDLTDKLGSAFKNGHLPETLALGVCPFTLSDISLRPLAGYSATSIEFEEALRQVKGATARQFFIASATEGNSRQLFARHFLTWALELSKISPTLCAMHTGLPLSACKSLAAVSVDRLTIEMLLARFDIAFCWRTGESLSDRKSICRLFASILAFTSPVTGTANRRKLLKLMLRTSHPKHPAIVLTDMSAKASVPSLLERSRKLCLEQGTSQRFFELAGCDSSLAASMARKVRRSSTTPRPVRRFPRKHQDRILCLCQGLTSQALADCYTPLEAIETFCLACILSLEVFFDESIPEKERGYWISRMEKRQKPFLQQLLQPSETPIAESASDSPQRITYREESNDCR